jgi:SEC-C motif-containing protein
VPWTCGDRCSRQGAQRWFNRGVVIDACDNAGVANRAWPATAEALMRSRFEAFRDADVDWLLACWHPSTRPAVIDLASNPKWRGLQIVDVVDGKADDVTGIVEFRATYLTAPGGGVLVLHERSRFVQEGGRWYYLDAETQGGSTE